jgi:preprotein translocase subunit SecF
MHEDNKAHTSDNHTNSNHHLKNHIANSVKHHSNNSQNNDNIINSSVHERDNTHTRPGRNFFLDIYEKHYRLLMIFSILLVFFSIAVVGYWVLTTGDFVAKGVTLKGGLTLTVNTQAAANPDLIKKSLADKFPGSDINVRSFNEFGSNNGLIVEVSDLTEQELVLALREFYPSLSSDDYSSEVVGPSLGASFFTQTLKAIFVAFIFMSIVIYLYFGDSTSHKLITSVLGIIAALIMFYANSIILYIIPIIILAVLIYIYFKTSIPSFGIMLCAFSDVFFSLAVFNLMGMKLNTAGVAAFLMLVGYSIDTDILLSVRVLKRREGTIFERTIGAMKTGMMMSISALIAVLTAYFLSSSAVIKEIMFILAVGLFADIIFTWIQNAGILRWHLDNKGWK